MPFASRDAGGRATEMRARAQAHLDDQKNPCQSRHDVELAAPPPVVAKQYGPAGFAQQRDSTLLRRRAEQAAIHGAWVPHASRLPRRTRIAPGDKLATVW